MMLGRQLAIHHLRQSTMEMPAMSRVTCHQPPIPPRNNFLRSGRPRPPQPAIPKDQHPEDFTTPLDKVVYGTLADPITPDYVRDVNDLKKKR
jgi:hypothetical protein